MKLMKSLTMLFCASAYLTISSTAAANPLQESVITTIVKFRHEAQTVQTGEEALELPEAFTASLGAVYDAYLKLKDALVKTNANDAKQAAKVLFSKLGDVDTEELTPDVLSKWSALREDAENASGAIAKSSDVVQQRVAFSKLSGAVYAALKDFGHANETLYYQHCPMAFNNKGAYWLSAQEQIANPYFGSKMMKCGTVKETIGE